jgi:hypothetical protein
MFIVLPVASLNEAETPSPAGHTSAASLFELIYKL